MPIYSHVLTLNKLMQMNHLVAVLKTAGIVEMAASIYAPEWLMLIGSTMEFLTVLPRGKLHATVYGSFLTGSVQSLEWQYIGVQGLYWLMLSEASPKTWMWLHR